MSDNTWMGGPGIRPRLLREESVLSPMGGPENVTASISEPFPIGLPSSTWQPGTQFTRYEIDSLLATGGMAELWRAKIKDRRAFDKRVVIKTILPVLASRPELIQMFVDEAKLAAALSHPNIANVLDFGQLEGRYFIAMEYVPGVTLRLAHRRMLARGERLPIATILHVMIDVCEALGSVHGLSDHRGSLGLVHLDLSPDNVIVSTTGSAKLIDFGAARATTRTPRPSIFVGKYRYAAPERINGAPEDRRSDVYSAGVILYECLTGERPIDGTKAEITRALESRWVYDPRGKVPTLPSFVAEVVMRAMAHDPAARFATARALGEALLECLFLLGAATKERDVTAALALLVDKPTEPSMPATIRTAVDAITIRQEIGDDSEEVSDVAMTLCEIEIVETQGPIEMRPEPATEPAILLPGRDTSGVPLRRIADPSFAFRCPPGNLFDRVFSAGPLASAPGVCGWRTLGELPRPDSLRSPIQHAAELFDHGIELRLAGRYHQTLEVWSQALALAPENLLYQSSVVRLGGQLDDLRRAEHQLADWPGGPSAAR
jgi:serine/threonine protein kinase